MFKLERLRPEGSDCTAPYDVILDKEYTVEEFVKAVLSNIREWGEIRIDIGAKSYFANPTYAYKYGELLVPIQDDFLHKKVTSASAHGGWSLMDYFIHIGD